MERRQYGLDTLHLADRSGMKPQTFPPTVGGSAGAHCRAATYRETTSSRRAPPTPPKQTWQDAEPNQEENGITQIHDGMCSYTTGGIPDPRDTL
jgi:hypothetical protein